MSNDHLITDLLVQLESLRAQGVDVSPVEVCRDYPELLEEVERRLKNVDLLNGLSDSFLIADRGLGQKCVPWTWTPGDQPVPGYRLVQKLGEGACGEVWEAIGPFKPVALKRVDLRQVGTIELHALDLIRKKEFGHSNLLVINRHWLIANESVASEPAMAHWLIIEMELAGSTLADRLDESQKQGLDGIPVDELTEYMAEAAKALDHLANLEISMSGKSGTAIQHRDIKPQNLLLVGGSVKVGDFGLLHLLEHSIASHPGGRTPRYASPESFNGKISRWSDQYSLAVTYCELRAGRLPFNATNPREWMYAHMELCPDLSMLPEEERLPVAKALAKAPWERWPSCREFVEALKIGQQSYLSQIAILRHTTPELDIPQPTPYFVGRNTTLMRLRSAFTDKPTDSNCRIQALSGQGGNGKTQLAMKYIEQYRNTYTAVFWIRADTPNSLSAGFAATASLLMLPEAKEAMQARAVAATKAWLESHRGWLLVLDSVNELSDIQGFVPIGPHGHILLTSRSQTLDVLRINCISVPSL